METSSIRAPFLGRISVLSSFVSPFIFYILSYLLLKTMGCFSGRLMTSASDQKMFFEVCSVFTCSFDEFVGEKVVSLSYSSALLAPPTWTSLRGHHSAYHPDLVTSSGVPTNCSFLSDPRAFSFVSSDKGTIVFYLGAFALAGPSARDILPSPGIPRTDTPMLAQQSSPLRGLPGPRESRPAAPSPSAMPPSVIP